MSTYRTHVSLAYNVTGQTLEFYPPIEEIVQDAGPPAAAATYTVYRGNQANDDAAVFSGTATLDSVSTTTQNIAGPTSADRTVIQLTSATGVVIGRQYLLTNVSSNGSQRQVIVPKKIAGVNVYEESEVWTSFDPLSTFKGLRHSFTVDSAFIALQSNINIFGSIAGHVLGFGTGDTNTGFPPYRVLWTYTTAGGSPRRRWTTFDVCRSPLQHNVSVQDVKAMVPDVVWEEWTQQRGANFQPQIEEAFKRFRFDVRMAGYDPNMVSDPEITDRLVTLAAVARIMRALERDADGHYEKDYRNSFEKAIGTGLRAWMQTDSSGASIPAPARQLWFDR